MSQLAEAFYGISAISARQAQQQKGESLSAIYPEQKRKQ